MTATGTKFNLQDPVALHMRQDVIRLHPAQTVGEAARRRPAAADQRTDRLFLRAGR